MANGFVQELEAFERERLALITGAGQTSLEGDTAGDSKQLLQIALGNEISVSELAAAWMPSTAELDVKIAFARQVGDEAGHFQLVADRLRALDFDVAGFRVPGPNPLFEYLRGLTTTVERVAGGLFALESIAYAVNQNFMAWCAQRGDDETVRIYREYIQPDELHHHELGRDLLAIYAIDAAAQTRAREVVGRVFEIASAAVKLGTACFPGC